MTSIRRNIMLGSGLTTAFLMAALGVFLYLLVSRSLDRQFRLLLSSHLASVVSALDIGDGGHVTLDSTQDALTGVNFNLLPRFVQIWNINGDVVYKSPGLVGYSLEFNRPAGGRVLYSQMRLRDDFHLGEALAQVRIGAGEHDYQSGEPGKPGSHRSDKKNFYIVAVAHSLERLNDTKAILVGALGLGCGGAALLSVISLVIIVSRGLAPVRLIAANIGAVGTTNLSDRLATQGVPRELTPIVQRLNELLARVQNAFTREKQLTADIAHELRTPIAGLRTTLELADKRIRATDEYQQCVQSCLGVTLQMQAMVENLLTLSRLESGHTTFTDTSLRVDQMVEESVQEFSRNIQSRELNLVRGHWSECEIKAAPGAVRLVVRNLLDNAVSYTDYGGTVKMELEAEPKGVRLRIGNTGSGIAMENCDRVFERFWRGDAARTQSGLHAGLGLSLAKRVLDATGGTVRVDSEVNGWFRVEVFFRDMSEHENG